LHADEKHIRVQSAISDKSNPKPLLSLSGTALFGTDGFYPYQKVRLARASAQWSLLACDIILDAVYRN